MKKRPIDREEIRRLGESYGFEVVRFCDVEPFVEYRNELNNRIENGFYPQEAIDSEQILKSNKVDPKSIDNEVKTIIALAYYYYFTQETVNKTKPGEPHGVLARNYMKDVYGELRRCRDAFANKLRSMGIKVTTTNLLPLKQIAVKAGVGWQGKNSLIINSVYGSWINLQTILIDVEIEPDEPQRNGCETCSACMSLCPAKAIKAPGVVDVNRCIDFLTCRPGVISDELKEAMGNRIVSCDRCQEVCRYNLKLKQTDKNIPRFNPEYRESPTLIPLLELDQAGFLRYFGDCDIIDNRLNTFKRNVIIALGNTGDTAALEALENITDSDPVILEARDWAINKIQQKNPEIKA